MKNHIISNIILFMIFLWGPTGYSQTNKDTIFIDHYKTKDFDCVIFPSNYVALIGGGVRFTPTREDINKAEKALTDKLFEINKPLINQGWNNNPIIHKNLKKYKRQYFGYTEKDGDKILFINCFWSEHGDFNNWDKEIIYVLDGGSHYWSIEYNITKNKLRNLQINGEG